MFEQLEIICSSVRQSQEYFGGLQVILCGDFHQLPPVLNREYNDHGELCFESNVFKGAVPHKVILTKIIRQDNEDLAKVIGEVSRGHLNDCAISYLKSLERPIDDTSLVKLFANNLLVDTYNRSKLTESDGDTLEFKAIDHGEKRYLVNISAQQTLWLKQGSPVILLRNISSVLVNGLTGTVKDFDPDGPVVEFPSVRITITIKKTECSVYSPKMRRNLATRGKIPLKLAYALAIHKAQGMTLDRYTKVHTISQ
ncbi:uncharacterized protein LOC123525813 [Mercenaria mercenaria]|uniref:uncharacterized protein LOC123525813 n=1 Tax=Mercenaria mercenaria TaxID=6596 RepID=UPI001E1E0B3F|nr:uncharacterized protein LOC123525813 [Mercenaria mercenaria]